MNIKELIESLIKDLYENKSLSDVFLKLQAIVFRLKNEQLTEWFNNENNGYSNDSQLPSYRILPARYRANLIQDRGLGVLMRNQQNLPIELIKDEKIREKFANLELQHAISEINNFVIDRDKKDVVITFTGAYMGRLKSLFSKSLANDWHIDDLWIEVPSHSVQNIISQVKSKLLQFLLEINENLNLDISFTEMENKEKIEKAFSQNITTNVYGNNNNVAAGQNVTQNINQSPVDYEKLKGYGVEEQYLTALKIIEKEADKNILKDRVLRWFSSVSTAVAARGLYENIPAIMECVRSLIN
jgi:hypothetical protein